MSTKMPVERTRIAVFGGIYSNYLALEAALLDVRQRGVDAIACLGDLGAFGPHPDRVFPLLRDADVQCMQGNYDNSIGNELPDCQCGYTDPRDNQFARLSYSYTFTKTSVANRAWMRALPFELNWEALGIKIRGCHGSPRKMNEFLWESTTSEAFLDWLHRTYAADVILATHTGLKWQHKRPTGACFANVGVLGRPENDGQTNVWYTLIEVRSSRAVSIEFLPVVYDHERLAREMTLEQLPAEFVETILTGWWTTCLEILPSKERRRGKF